jgi:hypothetical protein
MSRRNRTNRRRAYGKRQHDVRERRPTDMPSDDWVPRDDGWAAPESIDDRRRDGSYSADGFEGWAR